MEADIYTREGREILLNEDELEAWEEGFMVGYEFIYRKNQYSALFIYEPKF